VTSESAASLRSRYVAQAASDLEENRRRQQELAERIKMLEQEEALLIDIIKLAEQYESLSETEPPPEQAQQEPVLTQPESRQAPAPGTPARRAARTGSTQARAGTKGRSQQPLLGDLLMSLLGRHDEPRLARELRDELLEEYPDRDPTPQVVRNTLESLVTKGRIRRHKQRRSVMYTLAESGQPTDVAREPSGSQTGV
jgi:hypothetical protein